MLAGFSFLYLVSFSPEKDEKTFINLAIELEPSYQFVCYIVHHHTKLTYKNNYQVGHDSFLMRCLTSALRAIVLMFSDNSKIRCSLVEKNIGESSHV